MKLANQDPGRKKKPKRTLSLLGVINRWMASAAELLFPPQCAVCCEEMLSQVGEPLICGECLSRILPTSYPACLRCAAPVSITQPKDEMCPQCRSERFRFEKVVALGKYRDDLRDVLLRMKHVSEEPLFKAMGDLLADAVIQKWSHRRFDIVTPVPMHWTGRLFHGSNSAESLAEEITRKIDAPMLNGLLKMRRKVKQQRTLSRSKRRLNMRGAFGVGSGYVIKGTHVLLVDDILTTGATANEAARALKAFGASSVSVAVVARVVNN